MIGKKINQLATELAPVSTDLTIIGDPISGVSKKITLAQLGAIFSGAVSFYTDLASFPATGDINVIYCAKDTQKLYLWSGSAYVEVFPSQALLDTYQLRSEKGNANGYASLDSGGKVPISQLPSSIMEYKGTWNASTNTPTLANGTGDTGDVYICNVAGTVNFGAGPLTFAVGDYVIYSGSIWQRSSGAVGTVTSVAATITGDSLTISGSPVNTSGTLAFAFNGTTAQYIRGNGTLETFPALTGFVPYTGATANVDLGTFDLTADIINLNQLKAVGSGGLNIYSNSGTHIALMGGGGGAGVTFYGGIVGTTGAFTSSGSTDTFGITHSSGSGIALNITKGGNGEGLYINKTSGSGNAATIIGTLNATTLVKSGGTSAQFLKADGSVDSNTYVTIDTFETITASKNFALGLSLGSAGGTNQASVFQNTSSLFSGSAGVNVFGFNSANNIYFGKGSDNGGVLQWSNSTVRYYTLPDATGTIALVGGSGVGTVTSVSALTIGTSGTDISSTVANSTTTPVITLNVPTASATNRGALSSADWTTFNNKQNALTNPVTGTGTTNYLPKFTGTSTIGNSLVYDNGTTVFVNTTTAPGLGNPQFYVKMATVNTYEGILVASSTNNNVIAIAHTGTQGIITTNWGSSGATTPLAFGTNGVAQMTLSTSGNLGLGVTPSAWASNSTVLQITKGTSIESLNNVFDYTSLNTNLYFNSSRNPIYLGNGYASRYFQYEGSHTWQIAPSGTAGNAISFTQAMTLDASGRLLVGTTSALAISSGGILQVNSPWGMSITNGGQALRLIRSGTNTWEFGQGVFTSQTGFGLTDVDAAKTVLFIQQTTGNVGINTTSPLTKLQVDSTTDDGLYLSSFKTNTGNANTGASLFFGFNDGANNRDAANIKGLKENGTSGDYASYLSFATRPNGGSVTERMRITSGGNVEIATGSIKTGEPDTGWGRAAIKIGASVSGAAFNVTRYLPISVDGTVYYINLNSSTP